MERIALLSLHSSPIAPLGRSDAGGMNLYVRRLADELAARGTAVDMFTRRTDPDLPGVQELRPGVRLVHLDVGPPQLLPRSRLPVLVPCLAGRLIAFAQTEGLSYDVLHCHYWISGLAGLRCRDRLRAPVVTMFHTLSRVKEQYGGESDGAGSAGRFEGESLVLEESDAIVGATRLERQELAALYGVTPERFAVIPPGVDTDFFRPSDPDTARRRLNIDAERVVLFVGRLDPMKRLDLLLRAVARLPSARRRGLRVVAVGGNDEGDRLAAQQYRHLAAREGLSEIFELRSNVSQAQLPLYYSAATILAVPSAYESFGMVALEAMACCTPVLAFDRGGLSITVRDGESGFLARPDDEGDFCRKLDEALGTESLAQMGRRAQQSVRRYAWGGIAVRTLQLYGEVAAEFDYRSPGIAGAM